MSTLTNTGEQHVVNWACGRPEAVPPVLPYRLVLLSVLGTDTAPGTELQGGSYPAGGKSCAFAAATLNVDGRYECLNSAMIRYDNSPDQTVVGGELWDSGATPRRWFHGPLVVSRDLEAGDPIEFAPGTVAARFS